MQGQRGQHSRPPQAADQPGFAIIGQDIDRAQKPHLHGHRLHDANGR